MIIDGNNSDTNSELTTDAGDISITGVGDNSDSINFGIYLLNRATIESTGTGAGAGTITLHGTGGAGTSSNRGVVLWGDNVNTNDEITSVDGDIML